MGAIVIINRFKLQISTNKELGSKQITNLYVISAGLDHKLLGKGVFFLRNVEAGKPINP